MVMLSRRFLAALAVASVLAMPAWAQSVTAAAPIKVVTSFSILADMVRNVGGDRVAVTTLVGPDGDAHVFQPTPGDVKTIADAKVVFVNGIGFEGWIERLVGSAAYKGPVIVATTGLQAQKMADEDAKGGGHAHGHAHGKDAAKKDAHDHGALDPHAWQDLRNGQVYVDNILAGLVKADPAGEATYRANAAAYKKTLQELDAWVKTELGAVPKPKRKVITSHDAFGYFASAYGVMFLAPVGISTDAEPSAKGVANLIRQVKKEKVTALFVENITNPKLIEQIGKETGVKPGGRLYSDALSKPGQGADSYVKMFQHNVSALKTAMVGS
jgi:zinc/manganese transport system substrate-binding protein